MATQDNNSSVLFSEVPDPFSPLKTDNSRSLPSGSSVRDYITEQHGEGHEFEMPTVCLIDGEPALRERWDDPLPAGSVVSLLAAPGGVVGIVVGLAVGVAGAAVGGRVAAGAIDDVEIPDPPKVEKPKKVTPKHTVPVPSSTRDNGAATSNEFQPVYADIPELPTIYRLEGQNNNSRQSQPIEVIYGTNKIWPSYASQPYSRYIGRDQYQFLFFCIGHGEFDFHEVTVGGVDIDDLDDSEYEIVGPGGQPTLVYDSVETHPSVDNIELLASNEDDAPSYAWYGPFDANEPFSRASFLEVDIDIPKGLYVQNNTGGFDSATIQFEAMYREIDDNGNAGSNPWQHMDYNGGVHSLVGREPESIQTSINKKVPLGRYEVRVRRYNDKSSDSRTEATAYWTGLKAWKTNPATYDTYTTVAMKIKATGIVNDQSDAAVSMRVTRKLRKWDKPSQSWTAITATRSPVWAFCDLFFAHYGGNLKKDSYLDLDALYDTDQLRGDQRNFDWVFEQRTTVWEAARTVCLVMRAVPMLNGPQIYMAVDDRNPLPTSVFNPGNMIAGSFEWQMALPEIGAGDGLEVEYVNNVTGEAETVLCLWPGDDGETPDKFKLAGMTSRDQAYREGMYMRGQRKFVRESFSFATGLEGHIPPYGALVHIGFDMPNFGESGEVTGFDGTYLSLNCPVTFTSDTDHRIVIRNRLGDAAGPFEVTQGRRPDELRVGDDFRMPYNPDDNTVEPPLFLFGESDLQGRLMKVTDLIPGEGDTVQILGVNWSAEPFAYDWSTAPGLTVSTPPKDPDRPSVDGLKLEKYPNSIHQASFTWRYPPGASAFVVEQSLDDGDTYNRITSTSATSAVVQVTPEETAYLRVRAYGKAFGPWAYWSGVAGGSSFTPIPVANLVSREFTSSYFEIAWDFSSVATSYEVKAYTKVDGTEVLAKTAVTTLGSFRYTASEAYTDTVDDFNRHFRFEVVARNSTGDSSPTVISLSNPEASVPAGLQTTKLSDDGSNAIYKLFWSPSADLDFSMFRVYASGTSGFTPGPGNMIYEGQVAETLHDVTLTLGTHDPIYLVIGSTDVWGTEESLSAESTLSY